MQYTVRSDDSVNLTLCESDEIKSILQNLHLIITTPKGSIPMYRAFGLDMAFLDKPIPVMRTMMVSKVREAVEEFEPRAEFVSLDFEEDKTNPGRVITILEVKI